MKNPFLLLLSAAVGLMASAQAPQLSESNIDEVIAAMTLPEKAALLVGGGNRNPGGANGIIGSTDNIVAGAAGTTVSIPRLGIPSTVLADGPAGVRIDPTRKNTDRSYRATGFPVGVLLASTWNSDVIEKVGRAMGNEVLEYGCDVLLAPGMNLHRSPLCGRNFEYYSEDPVVSGRSAAAFVRGIQSNGVGVSLKHFAANSQETNRLSVDEIVDVRPLRELYLKGFEIAVKESDPWTVMSSYNRLNGPYTQENRELLTDILRDEWGFRGIVMTDWIGRRNTAAQVHAGNDLMEPGGQSQVDAIIAGVESGEIAMADVDTNVRRILEYVVKTPKFRNYSYSEAPDLKAHAATAREAAAEGLVLLKNSEMSLPVAKGTNVALFGVTSYDVLSGGTGSGYVHTPYVVSLPDALAATGLTLSGDLADFYESYIKYKRNAEAIEPEHGRWWSLGHYPVEEPELTSSMIKRQARNADMAIITIGRQAGEGDDRRIEGDFNLTPSELTLINRVCDEFSALDKKVVVALNVGGVIETASWESRPDAILLAWQPGQEGANAVADVITGNVNPSGKLTMTWPVAAMDHPSSRNFPLYGENTRSTRHEEGLDVGYRYFDRHADRVVYPFGHGLSYTEFTYSRPTVRKTSDGFTATVTVTNSGATPGKEAVMLFVSAPASDIEKPLKELKAFAKTELLNPGQSQTLTFTVSDYDLASFHPDTHSWVADSGRYNLLFAASATDVRASAIYNLSKPFVKTVGNVLLPRE